MLLTFRFIITRIGPIRLRNDIDVCKIYFTSQMNILYIYRREKESETKNSTDRQFSNFIFSVKRLHLTVTSNIYQGVSQELDFPTVFIGLGYFPRSAFFYSKCQKWPKNILNDKNYQNIQNGKKHATISQSCLPFLNQKYPRL